MSNQLPSESTPQATVQTLRSALAAVRRRHQWLILLQHSALLVAGLVILLLVFSTLGLLLPDSFALQLALFAAFAAAGVGLGWKYLRSLRRLRTYDRQMASFVESRIPDLEQRLLTSLEFSAGSDAVQR